MVISVIVLASFFVIIARSVIFIFVSIVFISICTIAMSIAFTISTITMSVAFAISVMVIASIAIAIQVRVIADRCVIWSKFMKVIEGSDDMRSIKSVGKFYFRWTRFVKHLNGDVFFPTFMQFFV